MKKILPIVLFLLISLGVNAQFVTDFSSDKTFGCAPLVIKFTDKSSAGANQWTWTSTAGISSAIQNPTLVFATPGAFEVTLESTNGSETKTKTISIRVSPGISVDFSSALKEGCVPFTTQINDLSVPQSSTISSWFWSFSNGTISTDQNPTVTFQKPGKFDVLLKITDDNGCEASYAKSEYLVAGGPVADFVYDSMTCSLPAAVSYINTSTGNNLNYEWNFGNGNTANTEIPLKQTYTVYDTIPVTLFIEETGTSCKDTAVKLLYLQKFKPKMEITATCNTTNFSLTFKDLTTPTPTSLLWDVGDGTQYISSEFTHTYTSNSSRTITLTSENGPSCQSTTTFVYTPPKASFNYVVQSSCSSPYKVDFTNSSSGIGLSSYWEYGDSSNIDTVTENSHNYVIPPIVFNPSLSIVDTFGCKSYFSGQILVPIPLADFTALNDKISGCAPLTINFIDLSKTVGSPVKEIIWDYGDPTSSTNTGKDSLSSHSYNAPGKYDVTMIVILENGCSDTIVKKDFILVGELPTSTDFNINFSDTICYGESLSFEGLSTYSNPTYFADYFCWAFEEGKGALLVDDETPPYKCPESPTNFLVTDNFVHSQTPSHQYSNYDYINKSSKDGYNYIGEMQASDSTLNTHLIIGFHGCYQELVKEVYVKQTAAMVGFAFSDLDFNLTECDTSETIGIYNASVNYDSLLYFRIVYEPNLDTVKHIAEFDTIFYTFDKPGNYSIQIGVYNKTTLCENRVSRTFQVIDKAMKIDLPVSSCWNEEITAIDESIYSTGSLSVRTWLLQGIVENSAFFPTVLNDTFRINVVDTGWNVISLGVSLRVIDKLYGENPFLVECPYSFSDSLYVDGTVLSVTLDTNIACAGDSVLLSNTSVGTAPFQSIHWLLKDSTQVLSTIDSFKVAYSIPQKYHHSLVISNDKGCSDTIDTPELLVSLPLLDFVANDTVLCKGESATFSNNSIGNDLSYTWSIESSNYINIGTIHTFSNVGFFDVKLHAIDKYTCEDSITYKKYVRVADIPVADFTSVNVDLECPPSVIHFNDIDNPSNPGTEWEWDISDGGTAAVQKYTHTFYSAGKYDVQFKVTNKDGCTDTKTELEYITVRGPAATATVDKTKICSPDFVAFEMTMTDVAYYVWDFDDGTIESKASTSLKDTVTHSYTKAGLINPTFTVLDTNDCKVVLNDLPSIEVESITPIIEIEENISCTIDTSITFINNSSSQFLSSYSWDFGNGTTSTDSTGVNLYKEAGAYDVKLTVLSSNGCTGSVTIPFTLHKDPNESLLVTNDYFCVPTNTVLELKYNTAGYIIEKVHFELENEMISGDSITLNFTEAKSYNLSYEIIYGEGNCVIDSSFTHQYYELPVAEFDYSPKHLSLSNSEILFTSSSANSTIWHWDFGDGKTIETENPRHSYIEANNYTVRLIASNEGGCTDTAVTQIPIAPRDVIQLPNAFTPDGDGFNDAFGILYAGKMDILSFKIFNRWGNIVFKTGDISEKWDGQYKGKPQNHGTYVYYVKGRNEDGDILEYKGNFSLIR